MYALSSIMAMVSRDKGKPTTNSNDQELTVTSCDQANIWSMNNLTSQDHWLYWTIPDCDVMWPSHTQLDPVTVADHSAWKKLKLKIWLKMCHPIFMCYMFTFIWNLFIIGEAEIGPTVDSHLKTLWEKTVIKGVVFSIYSPCKLLFPECRGNQEGQQ